MGHPERGDPAFLVAARRFCNEASNRTKWEVEGKSPAKLVAQKIEKVSEVRKRYQEFWVAEVGLDVNDDGQASDEMGEIDCNINERGMH